MDTRCYVLAGICFLLMGNAGAEDKIPALIQTQVLKSFPKAAVTDWKSGFINSDKLKDIAVLVTVDNNDYESPKIVAVFYGASKGGFKLTAQSPPLDSHPVRGEYLQIIRRSLFLKIGCDALCGNSIHSESYQFKDMNSDLLLIGEDSSDLTDPTANDDGYGRSINYLTGEVIDWTKTGKSRQETKRKFRKSALLKLSAFSYYDDRVVQ